MDKPIFKPRPHSLNLVYGKELGATIQPQYKGATVIDHAAAMYHGKRVRRLHADTLRLAGLAISTAGMSQDAFCDGDNGDGQINIVGLIDMTLKLIDMSVPIVWRFPESGLHPSVQTGLGDVANIINKRIKAKYR